MNIADPSFWWQEFSPIPTAIHSWIWLYLIIETIHILGIAILFDSIAMFDLRLLGESRHLLVTDMAQYFLPWSYLSFLVTVNC